jgi:hypothetical protein
MVHEAAPGRKGDDLEPSTVHPAWLALIRFCEEMGYGEIERLSIQNGLPVLAETTRKKVKFTK